MKAFLLGVWVRRRAQQISESFARNPATWVLFGLLVVAEWGNYETGRDLMRVCELIGSPVAFSPRPRTTEQEINNICVSHEPRGSDE
jgi:hypothetical protein